MILTALYYTSPGMISNTAPIFVRDIFNWMAKPIDFGYKIGGKPIFGSHKTFRGYFFAIITAIIIVYIQKLIYHISFFNKISYIDYTKLNVFGILILGFLFGFGAMLGDSIKSFIKRRINIRPGGRFFPWDQIDYVIGIILLTYFFQPMTWQMITVILIFGPALSLLTTRIGYHIGLRKEKW